MQGGIEQHSGTQFYNLNAGYSLGLVPKNITLTAAFNFNKNTSPLMVASTLGPTLGIAKTLMERKMRIMLSTSYNSAYTNGQKENTVSNLRANGRYTIDKKHNISISLIVLNRETNNETGPEKFTEFTGTLGYSFNFSTIRSNQQDVKTILLGLKEDHTGSGPFYIPFVIENIQREGFDSLKYLVEIAFDIVHVLVGKLLILHL